MATIANTKRCFLPNQVTLLADEDPKKRCFHCIFTDQPGKDGALGIISSQLLDSLYSKSEYPHKKLKRHHNHRRKKQRALISQEGSNVTEIETNEDDDVSKLQNENSSDAASPTKASADGEDSVDR